MQQNIRVKKRHNSTLKYEAKGKCSKSKCDMNIISQKGFVYLISFMIFFHLLRVLDIFPPNFAFEITRITTSFEFYGTIFSIILNSFILFIVSNRLGLIGETVWLEQKITDRIMWVIFIMFLITSMGYLSGSTFVEKYILSIASFFLAYFTMLIVLNKA